MTGTSTTYPEIEARIIDTHASMVSRELYSRFYEELAGFFPQSYDNPMGQVPPVVIGALEVIEGEVRLAAQELAKRKLRRKLVEGMEALLNAD